MRYIISDESVIQDETEQTLDEADQSAAADLSRYAETDVFARVRERIHVQVEKG